MPKVADLTVPVVRLTPDDGQYFFGYYDVPAADEKGRHLCHKVAFRDRFPTPEDVALLGYVRLPEPGQKDRPTEPGNFAIFGETKAWNFQQGSMLQWLGGQPDTCIYNIFEDGSLGACVHNVVTGARRILPRPVANVSQDGTRALCINMSRVYDFRPGYGYEELPDPFASEAAPEADGVWVMDVQTGVNRLVLNYAKLADLAIGEGALAEMRKVVVNHITFNPSATRFMFLLRTFPDQPGGPWETILMTASADGSDLRLHPTWGMASHYHWRNDEELLIWMYTGPERKDALVLLNDRTGERTLVDEGFFQYDGHCSYSPDGRWILYDSYPDGSTPDYMRWLGVYSVEQRKGFTLGRFRSEPMYRVTPDGEDWSLVDLRCDLHPRWMPDSAAVTFDSIHEGSRAIYWVDVSSVVF
ncbi:MAG: hypothetical protein N2512_03190 [Armatimonadetes bacterium]|nr:hypothetical protein [Armatimonadota bacterium]